ncbi:MAG TPA: MarR family winged helix-turn-helix transcriptional regulator [Anaeromyxobacteraceae bacterium]|nr:MarR family winged helix-turn-helix transcriptional regulator [Anaeromyxobacteraceae bacterium]
MADLAERCRLVASTCAATRIRQAARAVSQHYDAAMRRSGLVRTQFTVLVASTLGGPEGVPMSALARVLVLDRTSLTRTLAPLEKAGLVRTTRGPSDSRVRLVKITAAGSRRLARALDLWEEAQASFQARAGADWPETHERLGRVVQALTA